jgi:hypothetical protein
MLLEVQTKSIVFSQAHTERPYRCIIVIQKLTVFLKITPIKLSRFSLFALVDLFKKILHFRNTGALKMKNLKLFLWINISKCIRLLSIK